MCDEKKCPTCDGDGTVLWICPTCENGIPAGNICCPDCMGDSARLDTCPTCGGSGKQ
jgi:hypothetical protein